MASLAPFDSNLQRRRPRIAGIGNFFGLSCHATQFRRPDTTTGSTRVALETDLTLFVENIGHHR
jgi:hypothetical protein